MVINLCVIFVYETRGQEMNKKSLRSFRYQEISQVALCKARYSASTDEEQIICGFLDGITEICIKTSDRILMENFHNCRDEDAEKKKATPYSFFK